MNRNQQISNQYGLLPKTNTAIRKKYRWESGGHKKTNWDMTSGKPNGCVRGKSKNCRRRSRRLVSPSLAPQPHTQNTRTLTPQCQPCWTRTETVKSEGEPGATISAGVPVTLLDVLQLGT